MGTPCARNSGIVKPLSSEQVSYETINSNYDTIDASLAKGKWDATVDPAVTDDSGDGYSVGSMWANTTSHKVFIAEAVTVGAAVWRQVWPALVADMANVIKADGTVALSANWDAGAHEIRAETLEADVATGTAPLTIASTTKVANLNADKLDDLEGAAYAILAGQSGGQTLKGGTGSGDDLTLESTSHATKGTIKLNGIVANINPSLTYDTDCAVWVETGDVQLTMGCEVDSPYAFWMQVRQGASVKWPLSLQPLGGGVRVGEDLYVVGDVNCASVTDHTPAYVGDAVAEIKAIKTKDGKIDHTSLPKFCQKKYIDSEEKEHIGRDLGATISILVEAVRQLTARIEKLEAGGKDGLRSH